MRSSVLVRWLLASLAVAVCAIAATAYITTRSTTDQLERERTQSLAGDLAVRDGLAAYASLHQSWDGVDSVVRDLASSTGRRITLTTADGAALADSASGSGEPQAEGDPSALIDVLPSLADVSTLRPATFQSGTGLQFVAADPLVPEALVDPANPDAAAFEAARDPGVACLLAPTDGSTKGVWLASVGAPGVSCTLPTGTPTGNRYIDLNNSLAGDVASCATARGSEAWLSYDEHGVARVALPNDADLAAFRACATPIRTAAFDALVAPSALLYLSTPIVPEPTWIDRAGGRRIVLALALVLGVALITTLLLASRFLRPIRTMTRATQRMASNERGTRVRVHGNDEVARLGRSFNAMADSIETGERQRQQLVSDVAHELRNPLSNVRGYLEGAQDGVVQLDPQFVELLLDETVHLQHLVEDLQDVALADAGRLRLHVEPIDVADVIGQVVAANSEHARRRGIVLSATGDRTALVDGDTVRLRQVLGNLVANALRYTPPGGSVTIDLANGPSDVCIIVTDTGVGIEPEHLPHLFDRFYRADVRGTRGTGGSGLGLAICKYLVDAHGGTIEVTSQVGSGTSFTVTLPGRPPALERSAERVDAAPFVDARPYAFPEIPQ